MAPPMSTRTSSVVVQQTFMPSLLKTPGVTQARPGLDRLAIDQARLESALAERFARRLVEPRVPARRLHFAGFHPAVAVDQESQEHAAGLAEPFRSRRVL